MKIGITGHTGLLGKKLYEYFDNGENEIVGMSRSTGYDLTKDYQKCLQEMKTCDIVVNNAHINTVQSNIICDLIDSNVTLISIGSMAMYSDHIQYCIDKKHLHKTFIFNHAYYKNRCLLLVLGFLDKNKYDFEPIPFEEISNGLDLFLNNKRVAVIEYPNV